MVVRSLGGRTKRRGAHLVEFALVAPLFFMFICATVDVARGMMATSLMSNAARAGCRAALLPGTGNSDIKAAVDQTLGPQAISGATVTVQVNGATVDASTAKSKDLITVTVSVPVSTVTWLPTTWFVRGTLSGQFSLERE